MARFKCRCGRKFSEADIVPGQHLICACGRRLNVDPERIAAKLARRNQEKQLAKPAGRGVVEEEEEVELLAAEPPVGGFPATPEPEAVKATLELPPPKVAGTLRVPSAESTGHPIPPPVASRADGARSVPATVRPLATLSDEDTLGDKASGTRSEVEDDLEGLEQDDIETVDLAQRYLILGTLGRGGMGEVFRAEDRRLKRAVAIKRLKPDVVGSRRALQRFVTEAQAVAQLNHYNIVQVYDYGRAVEGPFLVLEFVDGPCLADRLKSGPLPVDKAVDLVCQVAEALSVAHGKGIVHRDVKPANILLTTGGDPKLTDFGVARHSKEVSPHTQAGVVLGTLDYMAPEQRANSSLADARSDQWSLGATLYQLVTGELPRVIDLDTVPELVRDPLSRALKTRPGDRFASVDEFRAALADALKSGAGSSRTSTPGSLDRGQCAQCGERHEDPDRRFCRQCGSALREPCLQCHSTNGAWEQFCGNCGSKLADQVANRRRELETLQRQIDSARRDSKFREALGMLQAFNGLEHPRLADLRTWAEERRPLIEQERLQAEELRQRLVDQARQSFEQGRCDEADRLLSQVPASLRDSQVESLKTAVAQRMRELKQLRSDIQAAGHRKDYEALYLMTAQFLELNPGETRIRRAHEKLVRRRQRDGLPLVAAPPRPGTTTGPSGNLPTPLPSAASRSRTGLWLGLAAAFAVCILLGGGAVGVALMNPQLFVTKTEPPVRDVTDVAEAFAGSSQTRLKGQMKDGQRVGAWEAWHPNGAKWVEAKFEEGHPVGTWLYFDQTGAVSGRREKGLKTGRWREWDADHKVTSEGSYAAGEPDGPWMFREGSEPFLEVAYDHGKIQSATVHHAAASAEYRRNGKTRKWELAEVLGPSKSGEPLKFSLDDEKVPAVLDRMRTAPIPPIDQLQWFPAQGPFDPPSAEHSGLTPRDLLAKSAPPDLAGWQALRDQAAAAVVQAAKDKAAAEEQAKTMKGQLSDLEKQLADVSGEKERLEKDRGPKAATFEELSAEFEKASAELSAAEQQLTATKNNLEAAEKQVRNLSKGKTPADMKQSLVKSLDFTREIVGQGYLPVVSGGKVSKRRISSESDRIAGQTMIDELQDMLSSLTAAEKSVEKQLAKLNDLTAKHSDLDVRVVRLKPQLKKAEEYDACAKRWRDLTRQVEDLKKKLGS